MYVRVCKPRLVYPVATSNSVYTLAPWTTLTRLRPDQSFHHIEAIAVGLQVNVPTAA